MNVIGEGANDVVPLAVAKVPCNDDGPDDVLVLGEDLSELLGNLLRPRGYVHVADGKYVNHLFVCGGGAKEVLLVVLFCLFSSISFLI